MKNGVLVDSLTGNTKKRMKRLNSKKDRAKAKSLTNKIVFKGKD